MFVGQVRLREKDKDFQERGKKTRSSRREYRGTEVEMTANKSEYP